MTTTERTQRLIIVASVIAVSFSAFSLYRRTTEAHVLYPQLIIAGHSQAPNQYRVLAPLLFAGARAVAPSEQRADEVVILCSIFFCFTATCLLFGVATDFLPLKLVFQIALLGAFAGGIEFKYRDSFFEVGFAALMMLLAYGRRGVRWPAVYLITALGSLNRETFIFALIALSAKLFFEDSVRRPAEFLRTYAPKLVPLFLMYALAYVGTRYYFGLSPYHGDVLMLFSNLKNAVNLSTPSNIFYAGGGLLFLFAYSLAEGNRAYLPFIFGYIVPLFLVSLFISNWYEHRIFYAAFPPVLAHVLFWISQREAGRHRGVATAAALPITVRPQSRTAPQPVLGAISK